MDSIEVGSLDGEKNKNIEYRADIREENESGPCRADFAYEKEY